MAGGLEGKVAVTGLRPSAGWDTPLLGLASEGADVVVLDKFSAPKSLFTGDEGWRGLRRRSRRSKLWAGGAGVDGGHQRQGRDRQRHEAPERFGRIDILVNCAGIRTPNVE